jgi:hypothetical protein
MAHHHLYYAGQTEPLSLVEVIGNHRAIMPFSALDLALLARAWWFVARALNIPCTPWFGCSL